jgi:histidinol dehydrogenase
MIRVALLTERAAGRLLAARDRRDRAAERAAACILADVRRRGDAAVFAWTRRLDGVALSPANLWVGRRELRAAWRTASPELRRAIARAARNIRRVAEAQKPREWRLEVEPGVRIGQRVRAVERAGCYVPGGRFSLLSTLLMTAIPAAVAGVRRIVVCCPRPNAALLAAAAFLGLEEIARVGGAQAIAALAYGTRTIPRVERIVGPGNRYVTAAKRLVTPDCATDLPAGPTELVVLAGRGRARFIAADMLAQAEHDPEAIALLLTWSARLAEQVRGELDRQLEKLPRTNPARRSLARRPAILLAKRPEDALRFANRFAPEHLSLPGAERELARQIDAAGSVFLGPWSAQPLGDYITGSNHVLPTGGWAHSRGGLSAADFTRSISVQEITRQGFRRLGAAAKTLAQAERLEAHRRAVEVRE